MALPGSSLTPSASDHPVWQGSWHRQSLWKPPRIRSPEGSSWAMECPVMSGAQSNEVVFEELLQESDGVTSCMRGCTILQKPGHAELVWGDILA